MRLPLAEGSTAVEEGAPATPQAAKAVGSMRIPVADDNQDAAETLSMLLQVMGHEVRCVHDGEAAVDMLREFDAELVLLDIGMPKLNGYETCRAMRAASDGAARTIVAVTGWGQPKDLQLSSDAGFDRHIVKPIGLDAINELIAGRAELRG
ncbi:response regulator [Ramlibacter terrae]|uniref:Response regulator n=1 Tax=Ramlibacter terrae TaxID=2732511 RepID=A0ABX6P4W4_9BURK|nr:response regulator [Ramlibacter terrae]